MCFSCGIRELPCYLGKDGRVKTREMVTCLLGKKTCIEWAIQAVGQQSEVLILQTHIEMLLTEESYCFLLLPHFRASVRWEQFTGLRTQASSAPSTISADCNYIGGTVIAAQGMWQIPRVLTASPNSDLCTFEYPQ